MSCFELGASGMGSLAALARGIPRAADQSPPADCFYRDCGTRQGGGIFAAAGGLPDAGCISAFCLVLCVPREVSRDFFWVVGGSCTHAGAFCLIVSVPREVSRASCFGGRGRGALTLVFQASALFACQGDQAHGR